MSLFNALILGAVQGLTEFLPVSSSGHLVILMEILAFDTPGALFEAVLHLGTLFSVLYVFKERILSLKISDLKLLIIGSIPAGLFGFLAKNQIESLFSGAKLVAIALIVTAAINYFIDKYNGKKTKPDGIDAVFIGIAQAIALVPGISRSGITILAGKRAKLEASRAAEFSFILSIPAIVGANILEIATHGLNTNVDLQIYFAGFLAALITGIFSIKIVLSMLAEKRFRLFSVYCLVVAVLVLAFF